MSRSVRRRWRGLVNLPVYLRDDWLGFGMAEHVKQMGPVQEEHVVLRVLTFRSHFTPAHRF